MTGSKRRSYLFPSLSSQEISRLERVAQDGTARLRRLARIVLLAGQGSAFRAIAAEVGLSRSGVRYWLRRYRQAGLALFEEAPVLAQDNPYATQELPALAEDDPQVGAESRASGQVSLVDLCRRYSIDMAHAGHVAQFAAQLFDALLPVHGFSPRLKDILEAAALIHNVAYELSPDNHHEVGRDIILKHPLQGFTDEEQRMLALLTVFHRKKVRPEREPLFAGLDARRQREVLGLSALLRIADGLDFSQTQTTTIGEIRLNAGRVLIVVEGAASDLNASRAEKLADLFQNQFEMVVQVWEHYPMDAVRADLVRARLEPDLSLPEAGRVLMGHYMTLVEQHAEQLRDGQWDSLAFFDRDVSRLHAVLKRFGRYYDASVVGEFKKTARWLSNHAEEAIIRQAVAILVRAADDPPMIPDLAEQLRAAAEACRAQVEAAFDDLARNLSGRRYRQFLTDLITFARQPGLGVFPGEAADARIGRQAALMIWTEFNTLRDMDVTGLDIESQWRAIASFHHLLQFLSSLLGEELADVLAVVQPLESQLRDMILGETVREMFYTQPGSDGRKRKKSQLDPALVDMARVQDAWLAEARRQVVTVWDAFFSVDFRRALALAIAHL